MYEFAKLKMKTYHLNTRTCKSSREHKRGHPGYPHEGHFRHRPHYSLPSSHGSREGRQCCQRLPTGDEGCPGHHPSPPGGHTGAEDQCSGRAYPHQSCSDRRLPPRCVPVPGWTRRREGRGNCFIGGNPHGGAHRNGPPIWPPCCEGGAAV